MIDREKVQDMLVEADETLKRTDLSKVTAESTGFEDLPDGYYLAEVVDCDIDRVKSGKNQGKVKVKIVLRTVEDGLKLVDDESSDEDYKLETIENTQKKSIYKHYCISGDVEGMKKFISDMKKFENPENPGEELFDESYWSDMNTICDALDGLAELNSRIWVHNKVTVKDDGSTSNWVELEAFSRATQLGLPVE